MISETLAFFDSVCLTDIIMVSNTIRKNDAITVYRVAPGNVLEYQKTPPC